MNSDELLVRTTTVLTTTITAGIEEWRMPFDANSQVSPVDRMVRLSTDFQTQSLVTHVWNTSEFMYGVQLWANQRTEEVELLASFATWQKRKLDYDGVYAAWLLEAISEEEFVEEASKFAVVLGELDPGTVVAVSNKLVSLLPFEVTTADLAEFLRTDPPQSPRHLRHRLTRRQGPL
jgi:hypothetical protein